MLSCETREIFNNTYFEEHLLLEWLVLEKTANTEFEGKLCEKSFFFSGRLLFDSQTVSYQRGMKLEITFGKAVLAEYFRYTIFFFQF